jgi:hypothetical protein
MSNLIWSQAERSRSLLKRSFESHPLLIPVLRVEVHSNVGGLEKGDAD